MDNYYIKEDTRGLDSFKLGYLEATVKTAVWFLEAGRQQHALNLLKDALKIVEEKCLTNTSE